MCSRLSWCVGKSYFINQTHGLISNIENQEIKNYMNIRYTRMVKRLEESTKRSSFWYYLFSSVITVGSIIVPSLISVQDKTFTHDANADEQAEHSNNVYWTVWGLSISVTVSNAVIKLLSLDKTYITRNLRLNQFKSEGFMFLTKTGDYDIEDENLRFRIFVRNIEKIRREQILEEYTPHQESNQEHNNFTMV